MAYSTQTRRDDATREMRERFRDRAAAERQAGRDRETIPRVLVRAVGALMLASLGLAAFAVATDRPLEALPPEGPIADERVLRIEADMRGAARVTDADGALVADLGPDKGGFVAGVSRALARVRANHGVAADAPVRLIRYADGRLALRDDHTGWRAELVGFGADNAAAFAALFDNQPAAASALGG